VAQDSQTYYQQAFFNKKFGAFFRINQLILRAEDNDDKTDLFQKEYLEKIYELQSRIENKTITFMNQTYSIKDFCYKPIQEEGCLITSPMDFWKMNLTKMREDKDIKETAKCLKRTAEKEIPCMDRLGIPIQIDAVFGAQGCENNEICDECNLCRKTARALSVTFLLNNDFYTNKIAEIWERDVFIDEVKKFNLEQENKNSTNRTVLLFQDTSKFIENESLNQNQNLISYLENVENTNNFKNSTTEPKLRVDFMSERSVPDELNLENQQNIAVVVVSYLLMFLYISIAMGEFPSIILSRVLVAFGGILVVILSFLGSIAIVSLMGIRLSLISSEVVPFLVLAIGVDNMFIITGAKDRKRKKAQLIDPSKENHSEVNLNEHIAATLKEVGPSITTAAFSEFLAFLVGYLTKIPALQSFCLAAAFAVMIDYLLQITLFLAIVTLDEVRVRNRRYDIFPCLKVGDDKEINPKGKTEFQKFLSTTYYNFLMLAPVKITIMVIYVGLIIVSIIGLTKIPLGLDPNTTVIQNSDLYKYFHTQAKYVDVGPPAYLVFYNIDYNNQTNLQILDNLLDNISFLNTVKPPVYSWYKDFKKFMDPSGDWSGKCNPNLFYLQTLPLEIQVREFLKMKVNDPCCTEYAVCGEPYKDDIYFGEDGRIEASRFRFQHVPLVNQTIFVNSLVQTKIVAEDYAKMFTVYADKNNTWDINPGMPIHMDTVFSYSLFYVYYDQYTFIRGISLQNTLIALASIFLAVQLIMNIKSAFVVTLFVLSCVFNLIGVLWLLNFIPDYQIELNAVSVVNIVLACGLSVEFTVHLIIFYLRSNKESPADKVRYALKNVGVSVFIGIVTTKIIGVSVLLFAPSKVFQIYYFRMYFFLIIVGFFHGFMILPIFLTMFNLKPRKHGKGHHVHSITDDRSGLQAGSNYKPLLEERES
jgi:Niemann-Pick C1 protein